MAEDYLKALGLSAKTKSASVEDAPAKSTQLQGITLQLAGMPETPDIEPFMELMRVAITAINEIAVKVAAVEVQQDQFMQSILQGVENLKAAVLAPVVPEFDAKGKIIGARKEIQSTNS